jgi:hypothetical protein
MWLLVLLFIVLQPGLFITIPPGGKKLFASGKKSWASILVHALIFVVLARYVVGESEGFQTVILSPPGICPEGTYLFSATNTNTTCVTCPGGKYRATPGATSASQCLSCPTGQSSNASHTGCTSQYAGPNAYSCNPGWFSPLKNVCEMCVPGNYCQGGNPAVMTPCPANTYNVNNNSRFPNQCLPCPAGRYSHAGATFCKCPEGQRSVWINGVIGCANCPAGQTSSPSGSNCVTCPPGQTSISGGACTTPISCPPGKYMSGGACVNCPVGTYSSTTGATSIAMCLYCPAGTYSPNTGATSISACISTGSGRYSGSGAGSQTQCPAGFRCPTSNTSPIQCTAGTYSGAGELTCRDCPRGQTSAAGATSASSCFGSSSGRITTNATAVPIGPTGAQRARVGNKVSIRINNQTRIFTIDSISYSTNPGGQFAYILKSKRTECCPNGVPATSATFVSNS